MQLNGSGPIMTWHLVTQVRAIESSISPVYQTQTDMYGEVPPVDENEAYIGQRVTHKKFGEGTVIDIEGSGTRIRVQISFDYEGTRWLMLNMANLS